MTQRTFLSLQDLVSEKTGIQIQDRNKDALHVSILERLEFLGLRSYQDYFEMVENEPSRAELRQLIDLVTVNETHFFRNLSQMKALKDFVLPEISRRPGKRSLAIWSAGCATGEEPYSIAIVLTELSALFRGWQIELVASDISQASLKAAQTGVYRDRAVRDVEEALLRRYFSQKNGRHEICQDIKKQVRFMYSNLIEETLHPAVGLTWDVIFCRNVMIYFGPSTRSKVVGAMYDAMAPGSHFFLGHSETLMGVHEGFALEDLGVSLVYRRVPSKSAPSPVVAAPASSEDREIRSRSPVQAPSIRLGDEEQQEAMAELGEFLGDPLVRASLIRAIALANRREYDQAVVACLEGLSIQPKCEEAHFLLGVLFEEQGLPSRAILHFTTAVGLDPNFAMAHFRKAEVERKIGKRQQSLASFRSAVTALKRKASLRVKLGHGLNSELLLTMCRSKLRDETLAAPRKGVGI